MSFSFHHFLLPACHSTRAVVLYRLNWCHVDFFDCFTTFQSNFRILVLAGDLIFMFWWNLFYIRWGAWQTSVCLLGKAPFYDVFLSFAPNSFVCRIHLLSFEFWFTAGLFILNRLFALFDFTWFPGIVSDWLGINDYIVNCLYMAILLLSFVHFVKLSICTSFMWFLLYCSFITISFISIAIRGMSVLTYLSSLLLFQIRHPLR